MAEPALKYDDYSYGNAAPQRKPEQQKKQQKKPDMKLVKKKPYTATFEQHDANLKNMVYYISLLLIAAIFVAGATWSLYAERKIGHEVEQLQVVYNTQHEEVKRLTAKVEEKITASVIAEYAETKLGMVKIPDSNKVFSDTGTENGIISE